MTLAKTIYLRLFLILAGVSGINDELFSQQSDSTEFLPNHLVEANFIYGMLLPHHNEVAYLNQKNIAGMEVSWIFQTSGKRDWEKNYRLPKKGISLVYMSLSSKNNLGTGLAIFPYVRFPIIKKLPGLGIKVGYGLGFIEKPFNPITNRKNLVIGSQLNGFFFTGLNYNQEISKNLSLNLGLNLSHFSNGSYKLPNLGINNITANLGMSFSLGEIEKNNRNSWCAGTLVRWEYFVFSSFSLKNIEIQNNNRYPIVSVIGDGVRQVSRKIVLGAGLNLSYNQSITEQLSLLDSEYEKNPNDNYRAGIHGSFGLKIGRNYFMLQQGIYLKTPPNFQGLFYHRLTSRFYVHRNIYASFSLKSHFAVADYFEFGLGYRL